jgi:hypothetical protein
VKRRNSNEYFVTALHLTGERKLEMLKPIKRKVVSFPDKGEYSNWLDKSIELNAIGFKISVSDLIEPILKTVMI